MGAGKKEYLERRIAMLEEQLMKAELVEARFGKNSDYNDQDVISFDVTFVQTTYSFVAIKIGVTGKWYTSSQYDKIMTWEDLVDKYLSRADNVWIATKWEEI